MKALIRWLMFLFIGLPFQMLVYPLYALAVAYWRLFIYKEPTDKVVAQHEWLTNGTDYREPDGLFLNTVDDHGSFCMYGAIQKPSLDALIVDGSVVRRVNEDGSLNRNWVSGDVVISWCLSFTDPQLSNQPVEKLLEFAWSYLKYLGTRSFDEFNNGDVSNRCNNVGINYCPDSDTIKLGQPMLGPQFYTTSALFALASKHSIAFKFIFWAHWLLLGGWFWAFAPAIWTDKYPMLPSRDMAMRALYVHKYVFGNAWWIRMPMRFICYDTTNVRNDLWYAMMGLDPVHPLPPALSGFFSQEATATSRLDDRTNGYYGDAIVEMAKQARSLNQK